MDTWNKAHRIAYKKFLTVVGFSGDKTSRNLFRLFQAAVYAALLVFLTNIISIPISEGGLGEFGDYFGGILNPILTFLTFTGLLITIVLQQKELRLTRNEIKISSKALSDQAITQEKQRFENTFFSIFSQHNQMLSSMNEKSPSAPAAERSELESLYTACFSPAAQSTLAEAKFNLNNKNDIAGHYFRTIYQILKLIATKHPGSKISLACSIESLDSVPISQEEKFYSNLVRSVLGYKVTQLLAINCYSDGDSFLKFKKLVIRYQLLEHMPLKCDGNYNSALIEAIDYYTESAFGSSEFLSRYRANPNN